MSIKNFQHVRQQSPRNQAETKHSPGEAQDHLPGLRKEKEEIEHFDLEMGPGSRGKLQEGHYQNQKKKN